MIVDRKIYIEHVNRTGFIQEIVQTRHRKPDKEAEKFFQGSFLPQCNNAFDKCMQAKLM